MQWSYFPVFKSCITLDCSLQFSLSSSPLIDLHNFIYLTCLDRHINAFLVDLLKEISYLYVFYKTLLSECSIFYAYSLVLFGKVFNLFSLLFIFIVLFTSVSHLKCQAYFHTCFLLQIFCIL